MFNTKLNLFIALMLVLLSSACAGEKQISTDITSQSDTHVAIKNDLSWVGILMARLKQVWQIPEDQQFSPDLKVTYMIKISKSGEIINIKMLVSSGNRAYDRSVALALSRIKLPLPPSGKDEWTLTFVPPYGN
jgi:TonB family protein